MNDFGATSEGSDVKLGGRRVSFSNDVEYYVEQGKLESAADRSENVATDSEFSVLHNDLHRSEALDRTENTEHALRHVALNAMRSDHSAARSAAEFEAENIELQAKLLARDRMVDALSEQREDAETAAQALRRELAHTKAELQASKVFQEKQEFVLHAIREEQQQQKAHSEQLHAQLTAVVMDRAGNGGGVDDDQSAEHSTSRHAGFGSGHTSAKRKPWEPSPPSTPTSAVPLAERPEWLPRRSSTKRTVESEYASQQHHSETPVSVLSSVPLSPPSQSVDSLKAELRRSRERVFAAEQELLTAQSELNITRMTLARTQEENIELRTQLRVTQDKLQKCQRDLVQAQALAEDSDNAAARESLEEAVMQLRGIVQEQHSQMEKLQTALDDARGASMYTTPTFTPSTGTSSTSTGMVRARSAQGSQIGASPTRLRPVTPVAGSHDVVPQISPAPLSTVSTARTRDDFEARMQEWRQHQSPGTAPGNGTPSRRPASPVQTPPLFLTQAELNMNWARARCAVKSLKGHRDAVLTVQLSRGQIISSSRDATVRIWDSNSGHCLRTLSGHEGPVEVVCVDAAQRRVFSASWDTTVKVWDMHSGMCSRTMRGHTAYVNALAHHGHWLLSGSWDNTLRLWETQSGGCVHKYVGHSRPVSCLMFDGATAISGSWDHTARVWDANTAQTLHVLEGHVNWITCIASAGHQLVASASNDSTVRLWDLRTGETVRILRGLKGRVQTLQCLDGRVMAGSESGAIHVWDGASGQTVQVMRGHKWVVTGLCVDNSRLVSCSADKTVRVWDWPSGQELYELTGHDYGVRCIDMDDRRIVSGSEDNSLRLFDFARGRDVRS
eukprot:TRINITY_DN12703_c0_g1_i1.p1 TRINITY_DN12703_c0_g1~~TRINITY_DN12703_c0_g1_i1.p1  ORF type:complete len:843 (-),score=163.51 TRINITY_DN12703_c0_g1_i1:1125-3653(-)